jgi:hypothetical protein
MFATFFDVHAKMDFGLVSTDADSPVAKRVHHASGHSAG